MSPTVSTSIGIVMKNTRRVVQNNLRVDRRVPSFLKVPYDSTIPFNCDEDVEFNGT